MNLHNLPNVIGAQRQLLKALDDAEIYPEQMKALVELDPEFKKYASVIAYVYDKIDPADIKPWSEINKDHTPTRDEKVSRAVAEPKQEWVPATKLRNMYPLAYSFLKNRVDLSAGKKEEIWGIFKKENSEYTISEDDFYRLMRLVINIRVEKAREIDDEEAESKQTEAVKEPVQKKKGRGGAVVLKDISMVMKEFPRHYYWLRNQQLDYLKKNTASKILDDFREQNPNSAKIGRTYFNMLIKQVLSTKIEQAQEPVGQYKLYPENEHIRLFEDGSVQVWTKKYGWRSKKPVKSNGYAKFSFEKRTWVLGKMMLTTFKPMKFADGKTHVPYYRDGNKMNCSIENLSWDMPDTTVNNKNIHEACEIIRDNPHAGEQELLAIMSTKGVGVQHSCLKSILAGNYTSISERYFTLQNGKPIVKSETSDEAKTVSPKPAVNDGIIKRDMTSVDKLVDTINYKKLMEDRRGDVLSYFKATKNLKMAVKAFEAKMELKMNIDASDKIIPVLEFSIDKDGNIRNPGDVLKDITRKYGNLYITQNYVRDVQNGKLGKEYSDLVFNK